MNIMFISTFLSALLFALSNCTFLLQFFHTNTKCFLNNSIAFFKRITNQIYTLSSFTFCFQ